MTLALTVHRQRVNDAVPVAPPLAAYEAWLAAGNLRSNRWAAGRIRRAVILRRAHDTWKEIARCCGVANGDTVLHLFERLPEHLK